MSNYNIQFNDVNPQIKFSLSDFTYSGLPSEGTGIAIPTFNAPSGLSATRNYTDFTHKLPLTRLCLKNGINYVGFPYELGGGVGYTLSDVFPADDVVSNIGYGFKIAEYGDGTGVGTWSYVNSSKSWVNDFTIDSTKGYVIKIDPSPSANKENLMPEGYVHVYIYAELKTPAGVSIDISGTSGEDVLKPYMSLTRRYVNDAIAHLGNDKPTEIKDENGLIAYDPSDSSVVMEGDLRTFEIGKAYLLKRDTGTTTWSHTYAGGGSSASEESHHMSSLALPSYINSIPQSFSENNNNWLYNYHHGIRNGIESPNTIKIIFDRLYTWGGNMGLGHRLKFIKQQTIGNPPKEKYFYQPLPPGNNDWIIAFTQDGDIPKVVGAQKLNDLIPNQLIESDSKIDVDNWDPYNNDAHDKLVGQPNKFLLTRNGDDFAQNGGAVHGIDPSGNNTAYRSYMGSININMRGSTLGDTEDLPTHYPLHNQTTRLFFMYYDSLMNKYYWLYTCGNGDDKTNEIKVTGENTFIWMNYKDTSGNNEHDTPVRRLSPIKGPLSTAIAVPT